MDDQWQDLTDDQINDVLAKAEIPDPPEGWEDYDVRIARAILAHVSGVAVGAVSDHRATMQAALDALEVAHAGLEWYRDACPDDVNGSDEEADEVIGNAMQALRDALAPASGGSAVVPAGEEQAHKSDDGVGAGQWCHECMVNVKQPCSYKDCPVGPALGEGGKQHG